METANEMRARVVEKAVADDGFRAQLMADPKAALRDALGVSIPDGFRVEVHEEGATEAHLVIPPDTGLTVTELEQARAGTSDHDPAWSNYFTPDWNPANW